MSDKQTFCPTCSTTYKVTVAQLTVAQGMVCCPKCSTSFNALSHMVAVKPPVTPEPPQQAPVFTATESPVQPVIDFEPSAESTAVYKPDKSHKLLQIFNQKVEHSNIDLKTYLNNLNYFSTEPIGNFPAVNWAENAEAEKKRGPLHYIGWGILNTALLVLLVFQFFWFNPQYLKNSQIMGTTFNYVCDIFNCSRLEEHYDLISMKKVKISAVAQDKTQFSGELINYHTRSLMLPNIRVTLKQQGVTKAVYTLKQEEYLIESLASIKRIPQNSPFKFQFELPIARKSFDNYHLEIIRP